MGFCDVVLSVPLEIASFLLRRVNPVFVLPAGDWVMSN